MTAQCSNGMPPPFEKNSSYRAANSSRLRWTYGPPAGLADVGVGLEGCRGGFDVAGRERPLVLADHVGRVEVGVWLQQRGAVGVSTRQRPRALVDPNFDDACIAVAVRDDRNRELDATLVAVERQDRLFDPARWRDDSFDVAAEGVALDQPGVGLGHEPLEGAAPLDAATDRVMELGLTGERLHERVALTGLHPGEVRHRTSDSGIGALAENPLQHRSRKKFGHPRHETKPRTADTPRGKRPVGTTKVGEAAVGLQWPGGGTSTLRGNAVPNAQLSCAEISATD